MTEPCFITNSIETAIQCWMNGALVAIPTETVYGLAAPVDRLDLIKQIFSYKERPFYDPLIVHVSDLAMAKNYGHWDKVSEYLARAFWPGPLTIVVPKKSSVDNIITSGLDSVGLRCPRNNLTLELIRKLNIAVAAPSANKFTKTSPTRAIHVEESFKGSPLCILENESDSSEVGIESTIVKVSVEEGRVVILRPGMITKSQIMECLKDHGLLEVQIEYGETAVEVTEKARLAPGQEIVHYKPDYDLFLHPLEKGPIKNLHNYEFIYLDKDPAICAREVYLNLKLPIGDYEGRVFILPKERLSLSQHQREQWSGIINRLSKAGTWTHSLDDS